MAASKSPGTSKTKFAIRLAPYANILSKLEQGRASEIDPGLLAAEIREHGFATMPADVQSYLCDFLNGNVEKRGRKGRSATEKKLESLRAQSFYEILRDVQSGAKDVFPGAVEIYKLLRDDIEDAYSPSEFVWRMVAVVMRGNQGHHKAVKNLAGKANSSSETIAGKPARK